jgi:polar amino acid transport system substrate-binding protein
VAFAPTGCRTAPFSSACAIALLFDAARSTADRSLALVRVPLLPGRRFHVVRLFRCQTMKNVCTVAFLITHWLCCPDGMTTEASIVFAVSAGNSLPLAQIRGGAISAGILMELGDAIAIKLHRTARYITVPRKRLEMVLSAGTVDGICYALPSWFSVPMNWSRALIRNEDLLVGGADVPALGTLQEVAGERLGVVLGYRYPELDALLGKGFLRDDSPSMPSNIEKLTVGRYRYAVVDRLSLEHQARLDPRVRTLSTFTISHFTASCAFSKASAIPFPEIDSAVGQLVDEGAVERILAHYR